MSKPERSELRWVIVWAVLIVMLASLPYMWGAIITPQGYSFTGLTHNIDDGAVYLSWMRQAADGHFFIRNLFTNEPQPVRQFNVLFLAMGWFAAITHLPLVIVFHLARIALGIALILCIWQFSKLFLDEKQRRLLVPLVGLSSGVGWLIPNVTMPIGSVDMWQPEAITFLSIYLNPLFLAGLLLMIGAFYWLELARREGSTRYAVYAGLHLLLLGNIHTYDVLTVACVWTAYLIYLRFQIADCRLTFRTVGLSALAAVIAAPSVAYQYWVYAIDPVYRARANSPIPSPPVWSFFEGYGLVLVGAVVGASLLVRRSRNTQYSIPNTRLLVVWSIVGFAVPYIPIAQQRKLIMGLHVPLCILCAFALSRLMARLPASLGRIALVGLLIFAAGSNVRFLGNDMKLLRTGRTVTHYAAYLSTSEVTAMRYLGQHAKPSDTILAPPGFSLFAPALTGRQVFYGHWSETPDFSDKVDEWRALGASDLPSGERLGIVHDSRATYYVSELRRFDPRPGVRPWFAPCFSDGDVRIYRVFQGETVK